MQIEIKNIWKIKEAKVNLSWLSIIAWSNDSWKSTVSKIVFSVIKAFQRYREDFEYSKEQILEKDIESLYIFLRYHILRKADSKSKDEELDLSKILRWDFYPPNFLNELNAFWWDNIFLKKEKVIKSLELTNEEEIDLLEKLESIKVTFFKEDKKEDLIKKALDNILKSEFENQLNNLSLWKIWRITLKESKTLLFSITIENNRVSTVWIHDDIMKIKDTTFIDTPIVLNFYNYLSSIINFPWRRNKEFQFHIKDLFSKIWNSKFEEERQNWFWKKVENIIWWTFEIIQKWQFWDYLVFKNLDKEIEPINTATWIKSFGILDLLDRSHNLDSSNLLILDEPEVHLHPEWQVEYAKLIISLLKERDVTILITSHSPYLIEAIDKYSTDSKISNRVNYYLSETKWKWEVISDKTENLNDIFEKLSEPFEKLVWW